MQVSLFYQGIKDIPQLVVQHAKLFLLAYVKQCIQNYSTDFIKSPFYKIKKFASKFFLNFLSLHVRGNTDGANDSPPLQVATLM